MKTLITVVVLLLGLRVTNLYAYTITSYSTGQPPASGSTSVSGTENSAVIYISPTGTSQKVLLVAVQNYGATAEVAMLFDNPTLPANGAIPLASCALPVGTANAPSQCSFAFPPDGHVNTKGIVVACSTTGKTLTVDATAGGVCYFEVNYQ